MSASRRWRLSNGRRNDPVDKSALPQSLAQIYRRIKSSISGDVASLADYGSLMQIECKISSSGAALMTMT